MKLKNIFLIIASVFLLGIISFSLAFSETPDIQTDMTAINDVVNNFADNWEAIKNKTYVPVFDYGFDYTVTDNDGNLVFATRRNLNENINDAIRNRDTIVDIIINRENTGKLIVYNNTFYYILKTYRIKLAAFSVCILIILTSLCIGYIIYLYGAIVRPFKKLQGFARHIAAGNFDIPLEMDRNNLFGAFTESFDLMREELNKAKQNEIEANKSKKELVASLSHDIKNPVASIKAVSELMLVTAKDEKEKKQLETIEAKAEQINSLITNMFHATLEELQSLNVSPTELSSTVIPSLLKTADYEERIKPFTIPNCIFIADPMRLQQIFDNIISNSYKYAGTEIEVRADFDEMNKFIVIDICDFGPGVSHDETPFLFNKFYRGKNSGNKSGYGLGLYISKYLTEQMEGELRILNGISGFTVRLALRLA